MKYEHFLNRKMIVCVCVFLTQRANILTEKYCFKALCSGEVIEMSLNVSLIAHFKCGGEMHFFFVFCTT